MACKPVQKLCPNPRISQGRDLRKRRADSELFRRGDYQNGCVYGIVIAQNIPSTTIIGAPVVITIGDGTVTYPLLKCNGAQATVFNLDTSHKYLCRVVTSSSGGSFECSVIPAALN